MDAENKPAENGADAVSPPATLSAALRAGPAASDKSAVQWRLILLVLCAVGAGLLIVILALQVTEYLFYKAPPGVWPQAGAGGAVSAPATLSAPLSPGPTTMLSAVPVPVATTTAPAGTAVSAAPVTVPTSASVATNP